MFTIYDKHFYESEKAQSGMNPQIKKQEWLMVWLEILIISYYCYNQLIMLTLHLHLKYMQINVCIDMPKRLHKCDNMLCGIGGVDMNVSLHEKCSTDGLQSDKGSAAVEVWGHELSHLQCV